MPRIAQSRDASAWDFFSKSATLPATMATCQYVEQIQVLRSIGSLRLEMWFKDGFIGNIYG